MNGLGSTWSFRRYNRFVIICDAVTTDFYYILFYETMQHCWALIVNIETDLLLEDHKATIVRVNSSKSS